MSWDDIASLAFMILGWILILGLGGVLLTVVISNTFAHDERKKNWHKGTHDYYGNELPKTVKDLTDD